jgi:3-oxoacyl-[acyl-carrier-protein] synthase-3
MTNADFEELVDTSDEWITTRTGIKERRIADESTHSSDMAVEACRKALEMADCAPEEIEMLVLGTVTPDYRLPSTACVVQEKLGLPNAVAYDIVAACTGFMTGLSIGKAFIESGAMKKVLVVGVEKLSSITNYNDRGTCVLFGDGAGAAVLSAEENGHGVLSAFLKSDGNLREWLWIPTGGTVDPYQVDVDPKGSDKIIMHGADIFKVAVKEMASAARKALEMADVQPEQITMLIPHQANIRIIDAIVKRLKVDREKVFLNIEKYGNTSAASIPIALDEANRQGLLKEGDHIVMVAFGGGLIWGGAVVRW